LRRKVKEQRRFFRQRSQQKREWEAKRDGSSGAASECRRIRVIDGELLVEIIEPAGTRSPGQ
jgi:hypothetical protein